MTKPLHKDGLMNILAIWHFSQKRYAASQWSVVGRIILRLQVRTQFVTGRASASGIKQMFHVSVLAVVNLTERNSLNKNTNISLKNFNFEILTKFEKIKEQISVEKLGELLNKKTTKCWLHTLLYLFVRWFDSRHQHSVAVNKLHERVADGISSTSDPNGLHHPGVPELSHAQLHVKELQEKHKEQDSEGHIKPVGLRFVEDECSKTQTSGPVLQNLLKMDPESVKATKTQLYWKKQQEEGEGHRVKTRADFQFLKIKKHPNIWYDQKSERWYRKTYLLLE